MSKIIRCINGLKSKHTAILGAQWGDEGKGKLVDILAEKYDICARFNGKFKNIEFKKLISKESKLIILII
jgi:hypothetical protein